MTKKLSVLLGLTIAVTGGVFLYEHMTWRELSVDLQTQTEQIASGYHQLIDEHIDALNNQGITQNQKRIIDRIYTIDETLSASTSLQDTVQNISLLQVALVSFIKTVTVEQTIVKDAHFIHLQKAMGETSDMRAFLANYNTTALRWNKSVQSNIGSLTASMSGRTHNLLPYLRFDGEQEFVTIIDI